MNQPLRPIACQGFLYRGAALDQPEEVWDHLRQIWVRYSGPSLADRDPVWIDLARAEGLKLDEPPSKHVVHDDSEPRSQAGSPSPSAPVGEVVLLDDGYGFPIGFRYPMPDKPGSHVAYAVGSDLVVEWHDHGDHAPYDSANLLIFGRPEQGALAQVLGCPLGTPHELAHEVARRCDSYFVVRKLADANGIAYQHKVDFQP